MSKDFSASVQNVGSEVHSGRYLTYSQNGFRTPILPCVLALVNCKSKKIKIAPLAV